MSGQCPHGYELSWEPGCPYCLSKALAEAREQLADALGAKKAADECLDTEIRAHVAVREERNKLRQQLDDALTEIRKQVFRSRVVFNREICDLAESRSPDRNSPDQQQIQFTSRQD